MGRFARIDSQIRTNRLILANRFRVPELNPFFANRASGGYKWRIAGLRRHIMKIGIFLRMHSHELIRANRPDLRCESPGHLIIDLFMGLFRGAVFRHG